MALCLLPDVPHVTPQGMASLERGTDRAAPWRISHHQRALFFPERLQECLAMPAAARTAFCSDTGLVAREIARPRDHQADGGDISSSGRALDAAIRPHASRIAGEPARTCFGRGAGRLEHTFHHDPAAEAPTEIDMARLQYPGGYVVQVSNGTCQLDDETQTLCYHHETGPALHWLRVVPRQT